MCVCLFTAVKTPEVHICLPYSIEELALNKRGLNNTYLKVHTLPSLYRSVTEVCDIDMYFVVCFYEDKNIYSVIIREKYVRLSGFKRVCMVYLSRCLLFQDPKLD